ncbi:hypothetical protein [Pontibacter pamirensis]|uniref:hypothetical protein n=1 Tax=Pontibacter pamirensis TaxID=2562824 RepID=UPI00138A3C43|nr:hypothetical protein [Pontibacter pamirensis]
MKKLTSLSVAFLSVTLALAQTNTIAITAKATVHTAASRAHEDKTKSENKGQSVAGVAKSTAADAKGVSEVAFDNDSHAGAGLAKKAEVSSIADGQKTEQEGGGTASVAQQAEAAAAARAKVSKEESNRATNRAEAEVNGQVKKAETHGAAVAAVVQGTPTQGQERGQEVKEVATTNQKEKPAKVEENVAEAVKVKPAVRRGGASRAAGAARAAGAVNARKMGAAARGAANGAAKPAKVNTNGASARPVQVGGAVKVNNRVKLRN